MSVTGEKVWISFWKIILFKDHTQTPKPNVCSYQKHPIKHTDFSFWAGVYIAWETTLAEPHAHFYHHVAQFLRWISAPCTLASIKLRFHSPGAWLFVTKKKKRGGLLTAAETERGNDCREKQQKLPAEQKVSHTEKEKVNVFMVKSGITANGWAQAPLWGCCTRTKQHSL